MLQRIDGSLKNIWQISLPILLTMLSSHLMHFIDRIFLLHHSVEALNTASIAGNFCMTIIYFFIGIASTAEVFVGQYHGQKQYAKLRAPTWQMLYFSLASIVVFWPIIYLTRFFNPFPAAYAETGFIYQAIILAAGPIYPAFIALAAFFVGRGKTLLITIIVICGEFIKAILNYLLIFGVPGFVEPLGCTGAALSTVIAESLEVIVIAFCFWYAKTEHQPDRKFYPLDFKLLTEHVKIGLPLAGTNFLALLAWYLMQAMFSATSTALATIWSVTTMVYMLIIFISDGLCKTTSVIVANLIGEQKLSVIKAVYRRLIKIALVIGVILSLPLIIFPNMTIFKLIASSAPDVIQHFAQLKPILATLNLTILLEILVSITWGVEIAGGDTRYGSIVYQTLLWLCVVLPTAILYLTHHLSTVLTVYFGTALWLSLSLILLYRRYRSLKWYRIL